MGGTYYSGRNSYEQTHKKYVVNSCNYLIDHTGNSFGYENKSAYQEGNEEGDKEASCLGEVAMIEFDPKKVINKGAFVHCKTREQAASFVEWVKKYYEDLDETLFWQEGDEVSSDYYYDVYGRNTVYLVDDDELYFDDASDCSKAELITFEDALLEKTPKTAPPAVEFDPKKVFIEGTDDCSNRVHCDTLEKAIAFGAWMMWYQKEILKKSGLGLDRINYDWSVKNITDSYKEYRGFTCFRVYDGIIRYGDERNHDTITYEDALLEKTPKTVPPAVEFDPKKIVNTGDHIHCETEEHAMLFVEWAKRYYKNLGSTLLWADGDEISNNYHYDTYKEDTVYLIDEDELYLDYFPCCDDNDIIAFGDALLKETPKPMSSVVEFDLSKFSDGLGIHCQTEEQVKVFFTWLNSLGARWRNGDICHPDRINRSLGISVYRETAFNVFISTEFDSLCVTHWSIPVPYRWHHKPYEYFLKQEAPVKLSSNPVSSEKEKQTKKTTRRKEQKVMNIPSVSEVIENVKTAATTSKDAIIQAQKGTALLAAVKAGLNKGPLPAQVKELINTPYWGDFVTGVMLHTVVPTVTDSKLAKDAVEAANVVASIGLSEHFSWIQDTIKSVIEKTLPDFSKAVVEEAAKE